MSQAATHQVRQVPAKQAAISIIFAIIGFVLSLAFCFATTAILIAAVYVVETQAHMYVKWGSLLPYAYLGAFLIGAWNAAPQIQATFRKLLG